MPEAFQRVCGTCRYGHRMPKMKHDQRLCFGGPPQIVVLPTPPQFIKTPDGKMQQVAGPGFQLQNARPILNAEEPECSFYEPKTIGQIMQDNTSEDTKMTVLPPLPKDKQ